MASGRGLSVTPKTLPAMEHRTGTAEPLDEEIDHVLGWPGARLIREYRDYERPYPRAAYREIGRVETPLCGGIRFAFRDCPLTQTQCDAADAAPPAGGVAPGRGQ